MARRKTTSTAEELMDLVARLPWWAGVALALLSYIVLHAVATSPVPVARTPQEISQTLSNTMWRGLAYGGQYLLPFICGMGALASAIRRRERRNLATHVSGSQAADVLDSMTWRQFELLVGEGFRRQGFAVAETGRGGADGGVDLVLTRDRDQFLVQCKQWKAFKVGVTVVRELYGVMAARGAAGGFVVTSGRFTEAATEFANGRNIQLIDGPALLRLIRRERTVDSPSTAQPHARLAEQPAMAPTGSSATCPACAKPMVRRVAKRGSAAGREFWGCSSYPGCKGTRAI